MGNYLRSLITRISDFLYELSQGTPREPEVSEELDLESALGMEAREEEETKPVLELNPDELGIFVRCSVCSVLHKLDAVCYRCGAPLCSDIENCRRTHYVPELGSRAIICPTCGGRE